VYGKLGPIKKGEIIRDGGDFHAAGDQRLRRSNSENKEETSKKSILKEGKLTQKKEKKSPFCPGGNMICT